MLNRIWIRWGLVALLIAWMPTRPFRKVDAGPLPDGRAALVREVELAFYRAGEGECTLEWWEKRIAAWEGELARREDGDAPTRAGEVRELMRACDRRLRGLTPADRPFELDEVLARVRSRR